MATRDKLQWLENQLPLWTERGVISPEQATDIRGQYGVLEPGTSMARAVFSSIGAILIGLGVILFFAFNWADMAHWLKLIVIFIGLAGSQLAGWWFYPKRRVLGESLFVLGTMMFGATIFLVSQIYHIDDHYPNAFLLWGVAALAMAWCIPSIVQGIIAAFLLGLWLGMEAFEFRLVPWYASAMIIGGFIPLAWRLRSRVLMVVACGLAVYAVAITLDEYVGDYGLFHAYVVSALVLIVASRMSESSFPSGGKILCLTGMALHMAGLYLLGLDSVRDEDSLTLMTESSTEYWSFASLVILYVGLIGWRIKFSASALSADWSAHLVLVSVSLGCVAILGLGGRFDATAAWVWANLAYVAHCGLWVAQGSRQQRGGLVSLACLLFVVMAIPRFLDMFDSLLLRSLVFLILGVGLFAVGNFYQKHGQAENQGESA